MLTGQPEWKEIIIVTDEDGQDFVFYCGWGVEPPVVYVPSATDWARCTPPWLHDRRAEALTLLESLRHVVKEGDYPDARRAD